LKGKTQRNVESTGFLHQQVGAHHAHRSHPFDEPTDHSEQEVQASEPHDEPLHGHRD
jgi:hypothetical protein